MIESISMPLRLGHFALCGWLVFSTIVAEAKMTLARGPAIQIVTPNQPSPIEQLAAHEMSEQLSKLFDAQVSILNRPRDLGDNVIILADQTSLAEFPDLKAELPQLSAQDHALKTAQLGQKSVLVVTGGSPRATLWAAYELGWHHGVRYCLFGDLYPASTNKFSTLGHDLVLRPVIEKRTWNALFPSISGPESWGLEEHRGILGQLAKLKYTDAIIRASDLTDGALVRGQRISVSGDTVGRSAFAGAKFFDNPDWLQAHADADRKKALEKLVADIVSEAHRYGISTERLGIPSSNAAGDVANGQGTMNAVLPVTGLGSLAMRLRSSRSANEVMLSIGNPSDASPEIVFLGRAAFQPGLDERQHEVALLDPVCGQGVAERVTKALQLCEQATKLASLNDPRLGQLNNQTVSRIHASPEPIPDWWGQIRDHYLNAMNEMYRANTRAREGGRQYTLYFARRFEYGFEYMNALEAIRKAGLASQANKRDEQIAELEKALDSITGACDAMAAVARSNSDRGIIALTNEYLYRPVQKMLESAQAQ